MVSQFCIPNCGLSGTQSNYGAAYCIPTTNLRSLASFTAVYRMTILQNIRCYVMTCGNKDVFLDCCGGDKAGVCSCTTGVYQGTENFMLVLHNEKQEVSKMRHTERDDRVVTTEVTTVIENQRPGTMEARTRREPNDSLRLRSREVRWGQRSEQCYVCPPQCHGALYESSFASLPSTTRHRQLTADCAPVSSSHSPFRFVPYVFRLLVILEFPCRMVLFLRVLLPIILMPGHVRIGFARRSRLALRNEEAPCHHVLRHCFRGPTILVDLHFLGSFLPR